MKGVYTLNGVVKHYDWGGISFIPSLLHQDNPDKKPFAEYWLGTHPLGISRVETGKGETVALDQLTGHLPYLFKAQEVKEMLSIQTHPSKEAAAIEFARENAEGIPLEAPYRNYKDDNHKPEMLVALGEFWLLHGFKPEAALRSILETVPELAAFRSLFQSAGYPGLYKHIMEMPQGQVNQILEPLVSRVLPLYQSGQLQKDNPDFWAAKAALTFSKNHNLDRGIFSIYLLNIVQLKRGEGLFQDAGLPHAYLEGFNVELMANSDNVLRGGLTSKHIDVKELLKHVKCVATLPQIIRGKEAGEQEKDYPVPTPEFRLSVFELKGGDTVSFIPASVEILLLTDGVAELDDEQHLVRLQAGTPSAVVFPGKTVYLAAASDCTVFRAGEGIHNRE
ncbi:MAG: mannose-6-phosphate isomerase, class I [Sphingobacteriales bacterium]|nr:mannose-6-phosphate isomerase, class I [Sphingobacteriales bacterium]